MLPEPPIQRQKNKNNLILVKTLRSETWSGIEQRQKVCNKFFARKKAWLCI
ncbi:hypothetical protein [Spiroplasma poulsonii]|uniref:hypothetical protein n=1 Tax=Spiroplasma poulsonii TaxID=2138 RepID=UPI001F4CD60E|nr:hypothetical protein [Spiroplasma poulsonii]UNF62227.1 hypothetical protein MNU24_01855 [Spiroplasma poulsonii]